VNTRRAPERVREVHVSNELSDFGRRTWPTTVGLDFQRQYVLKSRTTSKYYVLVELWI